MKIFLIGFNKCGTSSFHHFFLANGIHSVHHGSFKRDKNVTLQLTRNMMLARDPLTGLEHFDAFTDLNYCNNLVYLEGVRYYQAIHRWHPESFFILNTRDPDKWLKSRFNHGRGDLAERACKVYNCSLEELSILWRNQFIDHEKEVDQYFAAQTTARYLKFNIETDTVDQLIEFLGSSFSLDIAHWQRKNITKHKGVKADMQTNEDTFV